MCQKGSMFHIVLQLAIGLCMFTIVLKPRRLKGNYCKLFWLGLVTIIGTDQQHCALIRAWWINVQVQATIAVKSYLLHIANCV